MAACWRGTRSPSSIARVPDNDGDAFRRQSRVGYRRGQTKYSAAKAGIHGMAMTLAIELGRYNINVNAVATGFVETRMTQATAERMGVSWEDFKKAAADNTPLRRTGKPEDIASVIAF